MGAASEPKAAFGLSDVVSIRGLVAASQHNGKTGVVLRLPDGTTERFGVQPPAGPVLGVKGENLQLVDFADGAETFQAMAFWPRAKAGSRGTGIPVSPVPADPSTGATFAAAYWEREEMRFLAESLGWSSPQILSGIEHPGLAKPCWCLYFDAASASSAGGGRRASPGAGAAENDVAARIARHLPAYELGKCQLPAAPEPRTFRGMCVLVYAPMNSGGKWQAPRGKKWSIGEMREKVLRWHAEDAECARQYKEHDNPMHRMFGGDGDMFGGAAGPEMFAGMMGGTFANGQFY